MSEPLVTVITPTFNHERFIEACIQSVRQQTYTRWEMIVIDDASTDETVAVVNGQVRADSRIRILTHGVNWGAGRLLATYNQGLAQARGDLVAILEGDDWWAPDRLARQVRLLAESPSAIVCYADCWEVTGDGHLIDYRSAPIDSTRAKTSPLEGITYFSALKSVPSNTVLVRRHALDGIGGFQSDSDLPIVDYPTWLTLSLHGDFVHVPEPLGFWRRHTGSVYWRNQEHVADGCHRFFLAFLDRNRRAIHDLGLRSGTLEGRAHDALAQMRSSIPYFDAKYELLCGGRATARRKFIRALAGRHTTLQHRLASAVGLVATLSSVRVFLFVIKIRRAADRCLPRSVFRSWVRGTI